MTVSARRLPLDSNNREPQKINENNCFSLEATFETTNNSLFSSLRCARELLIELGKEFTSEQSRMESLENRLASARLNLAVLGQFKRGKSTLLNALLGEKLLPSAVVPVTSVPTFLSWGPKRFIKVIYLNGHMQEYYSERLPDLNSLLSQYVTENNNPGNRLGVLRVEVAHPSPLLQKGVVLIDTPGIGSTLQHNTEATLNFLPQCDGALFLISVDPPITQAEIEFLMAIRAKVAKIFFIMNKVDYLDQRERQAAIDFFRTVLQEQMQLDEHELVFAVSARKGLQARLEGNDSLWIDSGMSIIEDRLVKFLSEEKMTTLNLAISGKAIDILEDVLLRLRLKQRSLTMPLNDLETRLSIFDQKLQEVQHQRLLAQDILKGDQKRLLEMLEQECAIMVKEAKDKLFHILEETLTTTHDISSIETIISSRLAEVIPALFEGSLAKVLQLMNRRTQEVLGAHQDKANTLGDTIRRTAADLFDIPYAKSKSPELLEILYKPYWVTENWGISMSPIPRGLFERLLPKNVAIQRIKKWLQQDIESIILRNVESLRWATLQNIDRAFYRFSLDLGQRLNEIANATTEAIQEARTQRMQRAESISEELSRLSTFETRSLGHQSGTRELGKDALPVCRDKSYNWKKD